MECRDSVRCGAQANGSIRIEKLLRWVFRMWRRVLALLMAGGGLVEFLPSTALAAIVIAAAI